MSMMFKGESFSSPLGFLFSFWLLKKTEAFWGFAYAEFQHPAPIENVQK